MEFLVYFHIEFPPGMGRSNPAAIERIYAEEAEAAKPYFESGIFKRVWRIPGSRDHWALWEAPDAETVHQAYASFPMYQGGFGTVTQFYALAINPNDPGPDGTGGLLATSIPEASVNLTWQPLNNFLLLHGHAGNASEGESRSVDLMPGVSIHNHQHAGRRAQIHFMVDGVKIAEIGPPDDQGEEVKPGYIDFMAEWESRAVKSRTVDTWVRRIKRDNGLV